MDVLLLARVLRQYVDKLLNDGFNPLILYFHKFGTEMAHRFLVTDVENAFLLFL